MNNEQVKDAFLSSYHAHNTRLSSIKGNETALGGMLVRHPFPMKL